jgi:hypothetical protein
MNHTQTSIISNQRVLSMSILNKCEIGGGYSKYFLKYSSVSLFDIVKEAFNIFFCFQMLHNRAAEWCVPVI